MARVITSGLLGDIKGSIAGTTFQNSISGQIIRKKPIPKKSFNNNAQNIRLINSMLNYEWVNMSESDRALWAGKVGTKFKTDKNAFMNTNFYRLFYNQTPIIQPTFNPMPPPLEPIQLSLDSGNLVIVNTDIIDTTEFMIIVKASYPVSNAVQKSRNNLRLLNGNFTDSTLINLTPIYENTLHYQPINGTKMFISLATQHRTSGDISSFTTKLMQVVEI